MLDYGQHDNELGKGANSLPSPVVVEANLSKNQRFAFFQIRCSVCSICPKTNDSFFSKFAVVYACSTMSIVQHMSPGDQRGLAHFHPRPLTG